jgi:hypothetical protein
MSSLMGLVPDPLRGRVKSINGYLDIDEEVSEQNNQNLSHYTTAPLVINPCNTN